MPFKAKGRPVQGRKPDFHVYQIEGSLASVCQERTRRPERKSCFILATNQLDYEALSDSELIAALLRLLGSQYQKLYAGSG